MNSKRYATHRANQGTMTSPALFLRREQENARLKLALRELRHRCYNQLQLLIGMADMEWMENPQHATKGCSVRLRSMMYAFATLNKTLDTDTEYGMGHPKVRVRTALESTLTLLQAATEEDTLHFALQDAWLSEKECAALMLICAELVCNATKYGRKTIQVTFRVQGEQGILEVRDDGPGFPTGFCIPTQGHHGLQLVDALCRFDLNGEMHFQNDLQGGIVTLTFPVLPVPEVAPAAEVSFCAMEGVVCFDTRVN